MLDDITTYQVPAVLKHLVEYPSSLPLLVLDGDAVQRVFLVNETPCGSRRRKKKERGPAKLRSKDCTAYYLLWLWFWSASKREFWMKQIVFQYSSLVVASRKEFS